jgi:cell division septation protein DedD
LPSAPAEVAPTAAPQPALADASSVPARAQLAAIDLPPSYAQANAPSPVSAKRQFVSQPVVQPIRGAGQGSHVVQLGAFASAEGAQRAWRHFAARHAGLASYNSQFSEVMVKGRKFYRVQASGFAAAGAARQMCQSVKAKGGVCLVMAEPHGVTPQGRTAPTRMAQR